VERIGPAIQIRGEIAVIEIGTAMENDDRLSLADVSNVDRPVADTGEVAPAPSETG
jgi:hypothetical protein